MLQLKQWQKVEFKLAIDSILFINVGTS